MTLRHRYVRGAQASLELLLEKNRLCLRLLCQARPAPAGKRPLSTQSAMSGAAK